MHTIKPFPGENKDGKCFFTGILATPIPKKVFIKNV